MTSPNRAMVMVVLFLALSRSNAEPGNLCDQPGEAPDLVVAAINQGVRLGTIEGTTAYSLGNTHCNLGSCQADWFFQSNRHPVVAQNLFRLDGRGFQQVGQSWVTHGYLPLSGSYCSTECLPADGDHLGVNCSDVNSAAAQAQQSNMGPRSEVHAPTGEFVIPFRTQGQSGNVIYKRLQVHDVDLDPALNPGATYFAELQFVHRDDAAAGHSANNASWRQVTVSPGPGGAFALQLAGATVPGEPAIQAWSAFDPGVLLTDVELPSDGRLTLGARVTDLGGGLWRYDYALQNSTSHRSVRDFRVPLPQGTMVGGVLFHDVDSHSGEPYATTDWVAHAEDASLVWATDSFDEDPNANALRWGTLYDFGFISQIPPAMGPVTLGLFRPGTPATIAVDTLTPAPCDGDGICEAGEIRCACFTDCGVPALVETACGDGADEDCDGRTDCDDGDCCTAGECAGPDGDADGYLVCDCDDTESTVWLSPDEVDQLRLSREGAVTRMQWDAPSEPGATVWSFELLRSTTPENFFTATECVADPNSADRTAEDSEDPQPAEILFYVVRARNGCPMGEGTVGRRSDGVPRPARSCP